MQIELEIRSFVIHYVSGKIVTLSNRWTSLSLGPCEVMTIMSLAISPAYHLYRSYITLYIDCYQTFSDGKMQIELEIRPLVTMSHWAKS